MSKEITKQCAQIYKAIAQVESEIKKTGDKKYPYGMQNITDWSPGIVRYAGIYRRDPEGKPSLLIVTDGYSENLKVIEKGLTDLQAVRSVIGKTF